MGKIKRKLHGLAKHPLTVAVVGLAAVIGIAIVLGILHSQYAAWAQIVAVRVPRLILAVASLAAIAWVIDVVHVTMTKEEADAISKNPVAHALRSGLVLLAVAVVVAAIVG